VSTDGGISKWNVYSFDLLSVMVILGFMLRRMFMNKPRQMPMVRDASTQTDGYQDMFNRELDAVITTRLDHPSYPLLLDRGIFSA
ncbi:MAG: hypothetical protein ACKPKO_62770, partial [Candidatus Fonsibacter sp.]